jgi:hypothetical protein
MHRRHTWHSTTTSETERERTGSPKRVILTEYEERSRSGGEQWKRI